MTEVGDALRHAILSGEYGIGDKLPSEAQLTALYGVSRTVVREAVASLRADGLVEPRQGAGVFVIERSLRSANPFDAVDVEKISSIIELLELRAALEIEAAGLAAIRSSPAQEEAIFDAHRHVAELAKAGEPTVAADFAFHIAIAEATNNPRFPEFLTLMGARMIPRATLQEDAPRRSDPQYLDRITQEHAEIASAVAASDESGARWAMRTHLKGSQERYRAMIRGRFP